MSLESPAIVSRSEQEEETRFSRSEALAGENPIMEQIRAYTRHVQDIVEKTGKSAEQIVAEESKEVSRIGVKEFLNKLIN